MKTILFGGFVLLGLYWTALMPPRTTLHECDKCNDYIFCSCDVTCGENQKKRCNCNSFTCVCWCEDEKNGGGNDYQLPTVTGPQLDNYYRAEGYFRADGSPGAIELASYIRDLRLAITSRNLPGYLQLASEGEAKISALSETQWQAWMAWRHANLR